MKKLALIFAILFCIMLCFPVTFFPSRTKAFGNVFVMPTSLLIIENEAFEGTATEAVNISDSVALIGERAFAFNLRLSTVIIPKSVKYIGDHAFEGSLNLIIYGVQDSYSAQWAQDHKITFLQTRPASVSAEKNRKFFKIDFFVLLPLCLLPHITFRRRQRTTELVRSMRPQDRIELYPIDYRFP